MTPRGIPKTAKQLMPGIYEHERTIYFDAREICKHMGWEPTLENQQIATDQAQAFASDKGAYFRSRERISAVDGAA